jgi:cell division protein FtsN
MRDYKGRARASLRIEPGRLREFGVGLAMGLAVALVIFVADHRRVQSAADVPEPKPRHQTASASPNGADKASAGEPGAGDIESTGAAARYDFYQMLPKFEVVVPEREHGARVAAAAPVEQPGTYFLQVGSYRDAAVAERVRAQLEKLTIAATVQRVAVDNDVWHRVRIGPIRELGQLNRLRQRLQAADLDSLVIRVDD